MIEVGPGVIRRVGDPRPPAPMGAAALRGIDDPVVLCEDGDDEPRPVDVDDLLRVVLTAAAGDAGEVTVLHPSWWPSPRIARVLSAAPAAAVTLSRSAWIRQRADAGVVIEVGDAVAVCTPDALHVRRRPDPDWIIRSVGAAAAVVLDDPQGRAEEIRNTLNDSGVTVRRVDLDALEVPAAVRPVSRRRPAAAAAILSAALVVTAVVLAAPRDAPPPPAADESVSLVEGRLAVRVPAGWSVQRVTGGPGSARVEVRSPTDPAAVLHLTTAYTPQSTLGATAAVLQRAVAALPRDVFSEVTAGDLGGRPVLTYRERRPGRTIRWSVLLDGSTRIAIGCQSRAGRDGSTAQACERAVSSAREVTGTDPGRPASN